MRLALPVEKRGTFVFTVRRAVAPYFYKEHVHCEIEAAEKKAAEREPETENQDREPTWTYRCSDEEDTYIVFVTEETFSASYRIRLPEGRHAECTCSHFSEWLFICRHILFLLLKLGIPLRKEHFHPCGSQGRARNVPLGPRRVGRRHCGVAFGRAPEQRFREARELTVLTRSEEHNNNR